MSGILAAKKLFPFKFAILISGFPSRALIHQDLMRKNEIKGVSSFHIIGLKDDVIPPEKTREYADAFETSEIWTHSGGHMPEESWPIQELKDFLSKFLATRNKL
eukprot:TRINITY_DN2841_c0_g1_i6.p1 TRINITY_DN2841_c0_g1~~TRINITY_DN2841_c0_g1_i6.p1  ORF type:complete len:104 (-),score=37.09 TRINITY_DN2841_c0_g1_i6:5-316(-)